MNYPEMLAFIEHPEKETEDVDKCALEKSEVDRAGDFEVISHKKGNTPRGLRSPKAQVKD